MPQPTVQMLHPAAQQNEQEPTTSRATNTRLFMSQVQDNASAEQQQYDEKYYTPPDQPVARYNNPKSPNSPITLTRFLSEKMKDYPHLEQNYSWLLSVQMACKTISNLVNRAGLAYSIQSTDEDDAGAGAAVGTSSEYSDGRFYSMKRLDKISTTVLKNALKFTGKLNTSEPQAKKDTEIPQGHQPGVLIASAVDSNYVACFDPLDGSGNADASICTGTVFGVFEKMKKEDNGAKDSTASAATGDNDEDESLLNAILQPSRKMRMAGYCLYSSATVLVFTLRDKVYGFTLDPQIQEFVLTHNNLTIPKRGNVYSCNEANSEGWTNDNWKNYLKKLKLGEGETKTKYAHRYVGSMVGTCYYNEKGCLGFVSSSCSSTQIVSNVSISPTLPCPQISLYVFLQVISIVHYYMAEYLHIRLIRYSIQKEIYNCPIKVLQWHLLSIVLVGKQLMKMVPIYWTRNLIVSIRNHHVLWVVLRTLMNCKVISHHHRTGKHKK